MNGKALKYLILSCLLILIIPGNYYSVLLFESVKLIFGNIAVFLIAMLFHPVWAVAAALLSALIYSLHCGHFMMFPLFILEALFLSLIIRRKKTINPLIPVTLFWLFLGIPLSYFLYSHFLNISNFLIFLRIEVLILNALFAGAAATLILALPGGRKFQVINGLRTNRFFSIISSSLVILIVFLVFLLLTMESRLSHKRHIDYSTELLLTSTANLVKDIEKTGIRYGNDTQNPEFLSEVYTLFEHHRKDCEHSIVLLDNEGRIVLRSPESSFVIRDFSKGTGTTLESGVQLWMPSIRDYKTNCLMETRLLYTSKVKATDWIIQAEISCREIVYDQLRIVSLILLLLSLVFLFLFPILKIMSCRLGRILDSLIIQSSRNMYGLDGEDIEENWPDSNIWELSHLSYRLKEVMSHQKKATSLLSKQNQAFSEMNSALARSEENLAITLKSITDGVLVSDAEGRIQSINPVASRLIGYQRDENDIVLLQDILKLRYEYSRELYTDFFDAVLKRGEVLDSTDRYSLENAEGTNFIVTMGAAPIRMSRNSTIRGAVIVIRDVSEAKELEEKLRQSQKMEIVGQLAGGIAHDFNNLLGGISGMLSIMALDFQGDHKQTDKINEITKLITRASDLTAKLLSFSRKGKLTSTSFDFHSIIKETGALLLHIFPAAMSIDYELNAPESYILGDPTEVQRVLMNLALNARDAMQGEGCLKFTTANLVKGDVIETLNGKVQLDTDFLYIRVSDTGCGISDDIINHIFEPFFSTKDLGQGSGLGLSAVYGSILEHHGYIQLESKRNYGTVFSLFYPLDEVE